jgi:hypothetical protein
VSLPLAADASEILKWPFFGSLALLAFGILVVAVGMVAMLRAAPAPRARDAEAPAAAGPWDIIKDVVGAATKWGSKALNLFMNKNRSTGERIVGLGLFIILVGVLLALATGIAWAVASGVGGDDDGGGSTTPTTTEPGTTDTG